MNPLVVLSFLTALHSCYAERILFLAVIGTKSHKIGYMPIARALADRGHQVTVVNSFPGVQSSENVHEIFVRDVHSEMHVDWFQLQQESALFKFNWLINMLNSATEKGYDVLTEDEEFQRIVRERDVDLVVIDILGNDFVLPIVDSLNVPFVFYCPNSANSMISDTMEISQEYASIPSTFLSFDSDMTFFQRLVNSLSSQFLVLLSRLIDRTGDAHVKKDFPNARSITEIKRDASLLLMNHHSTTAYSRPLPPNVIPTGPLHVRPADPLPEGLQKLADESANGFIVFTLGSMISSSSLSPQLLDVFVSVFSKLPQRIIWKREQMNGPEIPSNVVFLDWIPQQDLIAHPNCRLLISHGGLLSLQEAIYHKMPFLGLPFGTDQHSNLARAVKEKYALKLDWDKLDEQVLFDAISTLLTEPSFRVNAERASRLMRDEILPGADVAVYWIEHVLRHRGAGHLQLASKKLSFCQKYLIDVWLFLGAIVSILLALSCFTLRCFWNCLKRPKGIKKQKTH